MDDNIDIVNKMFDKDCWIQIDLEENILEEI